MKTKAGCTHTSLKQYGSWKTQLVAVLAISSCLAIHPAAAQSPEEPTHSAPSGLQKFVLNGLTFEAPFAMKAFDVPLEGPKAENIRKMIANWKSMQGEKDGLYVAASVVTYTPDAEVSLDGAVKGAMNGLAANIKIPTPEYKVKEITIGGMVARRIDSIFTTPLGGQDRTISIRAVFILSGKSLAQLMTIDMVGTNAAVAEKILQSAALAAPQAN